MDFETVQNDMVTQLQTKITDANVQIVPLPEEDKEILPDFGKIKIVVAFSTEEADPDENTAVVVQNTHNTFSVLLQGKKLYGDTGLYKLANRVKLALLGFKPTDCRELTYSSHRFIKNDKKVFEYVLDFKTQGMLVQDIDDETGPNFQSAQFIEQP